MAKKKNGTKAKKSGDVATEASAGGNIQEETPPVITSLNGFEIEDGAANGGSDGADAQETKQDVVNGEAGEVAGESGAEGEPVGAEVAQDDPASLDGVQGEASTPPGDTPEVRDGDDAPETSVDDTAVDAQEMANADVPLQVSDAENVYDGAQNVVSETLVAPTSPNQGEKETEQEIMAADAADHAANFAPDGVPQAEPHLAPEEAPAVAPELEAKAAAPAAAAPAAAAPAAAAPAGSVTKKKSGGMFSRMFGRASSKDDKKEEDGNLRAGETPQPPAPSSAIEMEAENLPTPTALVAANKEEESQENQQSAPPVPTGHTQTPSPQAAPVVESPAPVTVERAPPPAVVVVSTPIAQAPAAQPRRALARGVLASLLKQEIDAIMVAAGSKASKLKPEVEAAKVAITECVAGAAGQDDGVVAELLRMRQDVLKVAMSACAHKRPDKLYQHGMALVQSMCSADALGVDDYNRVARLINDCVKGEDEGMHLKVLQVVNAAMHHKTLALSVDACMSMLSALLVLNGSKSLMVSSAASASLRHSLSSLIDLAVLRREEAGDDGIAIAAEVIEEMLVLASGKGSQVLRYEPYPGGVTLVTDVISWMLHNNPRAFLSNLLLSDLLLNSIFPFIVTSMQYAVWTGGKRREQSYVRTARVLRLASTLISRFACRPGDPAQTVLVHHSNMIFLLSMMSDADAKRQSVVAGPNAAEKPVWHRQLALECLFNYFLQPEISDQLLNLYRMCYGSEPPLPLTPAKEVTCEVQEGVESQPSGISGAGASEEANQEGSASKSRASAAAVLTDNVVERLMMSIESNIVAASTGKISAEIVSRDLEQVKRTDPSHMLLGQLQPTVPSSIVSPEMCANISMSCIMHSTAIAAKLTGVSCQLDFTSPTYSLQRGKMHVDETIRSANSTAVLHMLHTLMRPLRASLAGPNSVYLSAKLLGTYELFIRSCCALSQNTLRDTLMAAMCDAAIPPSPPGAAIKNMPLCKTMVQMAFRMAHDLGSGWTHVMTLLQRIKPAADAAGTPAEERPEDKMQHQAWAKRLRQHLSGQAHDDIVPATGVLADMQEMRKAGALLVYESVNMADEAMVELLEGLRLASEVSVARADEADRMIEDTQNEVTFFVGATLDVAHYNMGKSSVWLDATVSHLKLIAENPSKELREYAVKSLSKLVADTFTEVHDTLKLLSVEERKVRAPALREQKRRLLTAYDTLYQSEFTDSKKSVLEGLKVTLRDLAAELDDGYPIVLGLLKRIADEGDVEQMRNAFPCLHQLCEPNIIIQVPAHALSLLSDCCVFYARQEADEGVSQQAAGTMGMIMEYVLTSKAQLAEQFSRSESVDGKEVVDGGGKVELVWVALLDTIASLATEKRAEVRKAALPSLFGALIKGIEHFGEVAFLETCREVLFPMIRRLQSSLTAAIAELTDEVADAKNANSKTKKGSKREPTSPVVEEWRSSLGEAFKGTSQAMYSSYGLALAETPTGGPVFAAFMATYEECLSRGGDKIALAVMAAMRDIVQERLQDHQLPASLWASLWESTDRAVAMACSNKIISPQALWDVVKYLSTTMPTARKVSLLDCSNVVSLMRLVNRLVSAGTTDPNAVSPSKFQTAAINELKSIAGSFSSSSPEDESVLWKEFFSVLLAHLAGDTADFDWSLELPTPPERLMRHNLIAAISSAIADTFSTKAPAHVQAAEVEHVMGLLLCTMCSPHFVGERQDGWAPVSDAMVCVARTGLPQLGALGPPEDHTRAWNVLTMGLETFFLGKHRCAGGNALPPRPLADGGAGEEPAVNLLQSVMRDVMPYTPNMAVAGDLMMIVDAHIVRGCGHVEGAPSMAEEDEQAQARTNSKLAQCALEGVFSLASDTSTAHAMGGVHKIAARIVVERSIFVIERWSENETFLSLTTDVGKARLGQVTLLCRLLCNLEMTQDQLDFVFDIVLGTKDSTDLLDDPEPYPWADKPPADWSKSFLLLIYPSLCECVLSETPEVREALKGLLLAVQATMPLKGKVTKAQASK